MFLIFVMACKKYRFTYTLTTYCGDNDMILILRPFNTFDNIWIEEKSCRLGNYCRVFSKAIKEMKKYHKERR